MQVHAGRQLQGAADEIAGRRGREDQALLRQAVARRQHAAAGYRHAATGTADGAGAGQDDVVADGGVAAQGAANVQAAVGHLCVAAQLAGHDQRAVRDARRAGECAAVPLPEIRPA
ncbi:hypothetical protein G6F31_018978 [Rhizopus arrhizus]|nr:hypothetical protein G6F31_018978 [Rhizopus arrhizus]